MECSEIGFGPLLFFVYMGGLPSALNGTLESQSKLIYVDDSNLVVSKKNVNNLK